MRWLGLRLRIAIALVASVVVACGALTLTTMQWAADNREQVVAQQLETAVSVDADWLLESLERNPSARHLADLATTRPFGADEQGGEGLLIGLPTRTAPFRPDQSEQYVYLDNDIPLHERLTGCLADAVDGLRTEESSPTSFTWWSRSCGGYMIGYAMVVAPEKATVPLWLVVRARALSEVVDPVPGLGSTLVAYSAAISLAALAVAGLLAARVARPLTDARKMAEQVAAGALDVRVPVRGRDEVARMSVAVNSMADRLTAQIRELEHANEAQRRFTSDVAHELRTPTAALLASAEALGNPETRDEAAAQVAPQLRRLAGLTEDLLEISRMDAGRAEVVPSLVDVMDLVAEVVADAGAGLIHVTGADSVMVPVDAARLRVVVRNLVANALQHGRPPVEVGVDRSAAGVRISVHDCGPGVPEELRERVFDRFVRGDAARHGASSGLGLAIAAENARLLGGTLSVDADGTTFVLDLPTAATHAP
nr:HAMP domain-containing sensor histidine kinase [Propionicimonas sp.]